MTDQSIAAVRRYWGAASNHSASEMLDALADDYVHHDPGLPVPDADRETHVQIIAGGMFTAFPDLHVTLHDIVAEGDRVAVRWSFTGTHKGEMPGNPPLPATGKQIEVHAMAFHRVAGDKLAETWVNFELMGMLMQLGVVPTPGNITVDELRAALDQ